MKHLRPFNEAKRARLSQEIQDILNIAVDEGLMVRSLSVGAKSDGYCVWIYRYPWTDEGSRYNLPPLMDNDSFIEMVKEIYHRLDNDGLIIQRVAENTFYGSRGDDDMEAYGYLPHEQIAIPSDIPSDYEVGFVRLRVDNT